MWSLLEKFHHHFLKIGQWLQVSAPLLLLLQLIITKTLEKYSEINGTVGPHTVIIAPVVLVVPTVLACRWFLYSLDTGTVLAPVLAPCWPLSGLYRCTLG